MQRLRGPIPRCSMAVFGSGEKSDEGPPACAACAEGRLCYCGKLSLFTPLSLCCACRVIVRLSLCLRCVCD